MTSENRRYEDGDYDPVDDAWRSVAYRAIRERVANGGPPWQPKSQASDTRKAARAERPPVPRAPEGISEQPSMRGGANPEPCQITRRQ
jgi:hypothetical protein